MTTDDRRLAAAVVAVLEARGVKAVRKVLGDHTAPGENSQIPGLNRADNDKSVLRWEAERWLLQKDVERAAAVRQMEAARVVAEDEFNHRMLSRTTIAAVAGVIAALAALATVWLAWPPSPAPEKTPPSLPPGAS